MKRRKPKSTVRPRRPSRAGSTPATDAGRTSTATDPIIGYLRDYEAKRRALCALPELKVNDPRQVAADAAYDEAQQLALYADPVTYDGLRALAGVLADDNIEPGGTTGVRYVDAFLRRLPALLDRLAPMPGGDVSPMEHDPVVEYAAEFARLGDLCSAIETASDNAFADAGSHIDDRRNTLENLVAGTRARTLVGAMLQIKLAYIDADTLRGMSGQDDVGEASRYYRRVSQCLYSAIAAIEGATGVDRDTYGMLWMNRSGDPFKRLMEARAALAEEAHPGN